MKNGECDQKEDRIRGFIFSVLGCIASIWIAHNIYSANEYEISSFFRNSMDALDNFFRVVTTGKSHYTSEVNFTWWLMPFCGACFGILCCGFNALVNFVNAFPKRTLSEGKDVKSRTLAEYSSYNDFRERYKDFEQLSPSARKEVQRWFR